MPTYSGISPDNGSTLSQNDPILLSVFDQLRIASDFIYIIFPSGRSEIVWTGSSFGPRYAGSTRTVIYTGNIYVIRRIGGWDEAPMLRATATAGVLCLSGPPPGGDPGGELPPGPGGPSGPSIGVTATLALDYLLAPATGATSPQPIVGAPIINERPVSVASFLGRGLTAPLQRDGRGDFATATGDDLLRSNVRLILGAIASSPYTRGELPWRPEFGSLLYILRFRNNNETLRQLAQEYVIDAIQTWEPRVSVTDVRIRQNIGEGTLEMIVRYDVLNRQRDTIAQGVTLSMSLPAEM